MNKLSPFDSLIEHGGKNIPTLICSFADNRELSCVKRALRVYNQNAMDGVGRTLTKSHSHQRKEIENLRKHEIVDERPASEIMSELFEEVNAAMGSMPLDSDTALALHHWRDRGLEIIDHWKKAADGPAKEAHFNRLLIMLHNAKPDLEEVRNCIDLRVGDVRRKYVCGALAKHFERFIVEQYVSKRFQEIATGRDPQNSQSCLTLLVQNQKRAMSRTIREQFSNYQRNGHLETFSSAYFIEAEEHVLRADAERARGLSAVWSEIRPAINAGPPVSSRAIDIRNWMMNDDNREMLGQIRALDLRGLSILPNEIGRLHNLQVLNCFGGLEALTDLPPEIANLGNLRELRLGHNNFREIPVVLQNLPALESVSFWGNLSPIRVLPYEFAERLYGGGIANKIKLLLKNELYQLRLFAQAVGLIRIENEIRAFCGDDTIYANLAPSEFSDIPFNVWFRERCSVPNFPCFIWFCCMRAITDIHEHRLENGLVKKIIFFTVFSMSTIALGILALPFALLNFILNLVIEPIIEEIRDELAYGRMIHVRDFPAEPAAGSQA